MNNLLWAFGFVAVFWSVVGTVVYIRMRVEDMSRESDDD
jgi:NADH:ubiquinone oxidoreductase subunit 2 (subunit N)